MFVLDKAGVISTCSESSTAVALFDSIPFLTASKLFRTLWRRGPEGES